MHRKLLSPLLGKISCSFGKKTIKHVQMYCLLKEGNTFSRKGVLSVFWVLFFLNTKKKDIKLWVHSFVADVANPSKPPIYFFLLEYCWNMMEACENVANSCPRSPSNDHLVIGSRHQVSLVLQKMVDKSTKICGGSHH